MSKIFSGCLLEASLAARLPAELAFRCAEPEPTAVEGSLLKQSSPRASLLQKSHVLRRVKKMIEVM